jgi:hypothetical protein
MWNKKLYFSDNLVAKQVHSLVSVCCNCSLNARHCTPVYCYIAGDRAAIQPRDHVAVDVASCSACNVVDVIARDAARTNTLRINITFACILLRMMISCFNVWFI